LRLDASKKTRNVSTNSTFVGKRKQGVQGVARSYKTSVFAQKHLSKVENKNKAIVLNSLQLLELLELQKVESLRNLSQLIFNYFKLKTPKK